MGEWLQKAALVGWMAAGATGALAQSGVYTCVDDKGRRLTSDRLIPECADREQRVIGPTGTLRAVVPPTLTAKERDALAEQERRTAEEKLRQAEERRVERALLARYPNQPAHDLERVKALRSVEEATVATKRQIEELARQKAKIKEEAEFYKDPAKYPPKLKRQLEDNEQQVAAQQRQLSAQEEERRRLNKRFDEELARLKVLWTSPGGVAAASAPVKR